MILSEKRGILLVKSEIRVSVTRVDKVLEITIS